MDSLLLNDKPYKAPQSYEGNPVGLPDEAAKEMAKELDRHLSAFFILYQQYHKHHWLTEGPQFRDIHLFLEEHYNEIHGQYDEIAERLTLLGMAPTCHPANMVELSYVKHEPEGTFRVREMLTRDLVAERHISEEMRKTIKRAFELGDFATRGLLEKILIATEDRAQHVEHFLADDTLTELSIRGSKAVNLVVEKKEEAE